MNLDNPLEIALTIFLALLSIFIIERIIAKAFKTVVLGIILALGFFSYTFYFHKENLKKSKPQYRFTVHDLVDYPDFKKKINHYKTETKNDIIKDYFKARRDLMQ